MNKNTQDSREETGCIKHQAMNDYKKPQMIECGLNPCHEWDYTNDYKAASARLKL